jgi:hypothetical protein
MLALLFKDERRKKKKKKHRSRKNRKASVEATSDDSISSSESSQDYQRWTKKRAKILEKEREKLIAQWKAEAMAEELASREQREKGRWGRRIGRHLDSEVSTFLDSSLKFLAWFESFIANLPLTIGAIALANATLGVVWFKFAEENMQSCAPVHFHSSQCNFPEFPGCFYCDKDASMYKVALNFHLICSMFGGFLALGFVLKLILARRVVFDELSSPTTASPAGLLCMTIDIVAAGHGFLGQVLVSVAAGVHLCLVVWFIYMVRFAPVI